jgi:hypothetical protein
MTTSTAAPDPTSTLHPDDEPYLVQESMLYYTTNNLQKEVLARHERNKALRLAREAECNASLKRAAEKKMKVRLFELRYGVAAKGIVGVYTDNTRTAINEVAVQRLIDHHDVIPRDRVSNADKAVRIVRRELLSKGLLPTKEEIARRAQQRAREYARYLAAQQAEFEKGKVQEVTRDGGKGGIMAYRVWVDANRTSAE